MILEKTHQLFLYDDSEHSFELVMACLIKFCGHAKDQAEQCALIAHNNGKCDIKSGTYLEMLEISEMLESIGLKVEILDNESSLH